MTLILESLEKSIVYSIGSSGVYIVETGQEDCSLWNDLKRIREELRSGTSSVHI